jgi:hypothetical protein
LKGILKGITKGIIKAFFTGILKSIFEGIIKGFFKGFFKGIVLVSLRVIDGSFCPGNEFNPSPWFEAYSLFLSDRLLELSIGYWVLG